MPSTNGHGSKRAILYAHVSTDGQARAGYSLAQQLEALREYASREGYEVLEEFSDPGQSGASLERPGMDRVRDLLTLIALLAQMSEAPACTWLSDSGGELEDLPGHNVCLPKVVIYESARGSEESLSGRFASPKSHDRDSL